MELWKAIAAYQPKTQKPCIYQWECIAPEKDEDGARYYIGQAKTDRAFARYIQHIFANDHLGLSIRKYGLHNFRYTVLAFCEHDSQLDDLEKQYIAWAIADGKKLYNVSGGGQGDQRTSNVGASHRRKLTERQKLANKYKRLHHSEPPSSWSAEKIKTKLEETK